VKKRPPSAPAPAASPDQGEGAAAQGNPVVELSRFRADLGRGKRQRRADTLLAAADPRAAVRALPGDEFYYVMHELGFPDATELLQYGSPEQVQTALDFALWDRDKLEPAAASLWLDAMVEAPAVVVGAWAQGLDIELMALLFRTRTRIFDVSLEEEPPEPEGTFWSSPDRLFLIDLLGSEDEQRVTQQLLDTLYRYDRQWMRRVLIGTRSELDAELEEHAYRWRSGRMADLGFEEYYVALEVYRELDPASVRLGDDPAPRVRPLTDEIEPAYLGIPAALADRLRTASPFARAISGVSDRAELQNLEAALRTLSNRVLAADRVTPGDDEEVTAVLHRMAATLDLAVELLARGAPEDGVRAVRSIPLVRLFQLGTTLIGKLRRLAVTLRKQNPFSHLRPAIQIFEADHAEVVEACGRLRPLFPRLLDQPPASGERPFATLADLHRASGALEEAAAAVTLLVGLGVRPEQLTAVGPDALADPAALDTGLLARTVLARTLLQGPSPELAALAPLDAAFAQELKNYLKDIDQDADRKAKAQEQLVRLVIARWPTATPSPGARAVSQRWSEGLLRGEPVLTR
jgi:hypothetical protein